MLTPVVKALDSLESISKMLFQKMLLLQEKMRTSENEKHFMEFSTSALTDKSEFIIKMSFSFCFI